MRVLTPALSLFGFAVLPSHGGPSSKRRVAAREVHALAATQSVTIRYQRVTQGTLRAAVVTVTPT